MKKRRTFAICDKEQNYAYGLAERIEKEEKFQIRAAAFTDIENLEAYGKNCEIEVLLIATDLWSDKIEKLSVKKIILLTDGKEDFLSEAYEKIDKYQSSKEIIRQIQSIYGKVREDTAEERRFGKQTEWIGVYSPIGRCGKTFSLCAAKILSEKRKVLYLNMEDYSGLEEEDLPVDEADFKDISDFIYYMKQSEEKVLQYLREAMKIWEGFAFIYPVFLPGHIGEIRTSEWKQFLKMLEKTKEYEVIIIDLGNRVENPAEILNLCGKVYMPVLQDEISVKREDSLKDF